MADSREFVLIGRFDDQITGSLEKINNSLNSLKKNLGSFGAKKGGFNDLTKSMGKVIGAHVKLSEEVRTLRSELTKSIPALREYRKEVGKTVSGNMMLQGKGKGQRFNKKNNPTLQFLDAATRQTRLLSQASRGVRLGGRTPRGVGGGGGGGGGGGAYVPRSPRPPRPPGGGGGGGRGGYSPPPRSTSTFGTKKFGVSRDETFAFGQTLGYTLGSTITGAITQGFMIGVGLMTKPFEYFAKNLQERIEDEQSDIKSAGGIFSIARRQKDPFVKTMDEAMEFTQQNNKYMAELADALPGNTQQYIEVSKRLSDSISRIVMADQTKAIQYSNKLREEEGIGALEGNKQAQTKGAITQLLGEMTKKTVLAGLGTGGGPGGVAGAYGLPQLSERMLTQQSVSMGQFQRYAAIFKDPLIMDALNRFIPKINASAAGTMERFEVMQKFYDEVVPKEMIRKFERSTAGVLELFNTTIFGPETGLFGLGRKMEGMGVVMDDYGNYIKVFEDGTRKVVTSLGEASNANLSLFDMLRDSFANLGIALYPVLRNLGGIFDPINKVSKLLVDFRQATGRFLFAFESYKKGFEDMIKGMDPAKKKEFLKTGLDLRASLAAVNNFFAKTGIIDNNQFLANAKQLMSTSLDSKAMISGMLNTFLKSNVAGDLGTLIGQIVGTVMSETAKAVAFFAGLTDNSSKLAEGLKKGFYAAGGPEAFRSIIQNVFKALFKAAFEIFKAAPLEITALGSIALLLPAAVAAFSVAFANKFEKVLDFARGGIDRQLGSLKTRLGRSAKPGLKLGGLGAGLKPTAKTTGISNAAFRPVGPRPPKGFEHIALSGKAPSLVGGVTSPGKAPNIPKPMAALKRTPFGALSKIKAKGVGALASAMMTITTKAPVLEKVAAALKGPGLEGLKKPGQLLGKGMGTATILGGLANGLMKLLSGGNIWEGLGATAGPIIGTMIGTALLGPLGGFIGGWIGSMESVTTPLAQTFESLYNTLSVTFEFIGQIGSDIMGLLNGLVGLLPGVGEGFDLLKFALFALLSPFRLLELGIRGLYVLYLKMKSNLGLASKDEKEKLAKAEQDLAMRTAQFVIDGEEARGVNKKTQLGEAKAQLEALRTKRAAENANLPRIRNSTTPMGAKGVTEEEKLLQTRIGLLSKQNAGSKVSQTPAAIKEGTSKTTATVRTGTDKTTAAVKELTAKTTTQSSLQSTVAAIYSLMASGMLRVQTSMAGINPMTGQPGLAGVLGLPVPLGTKSGAPLPGFNWDQLTKPQPKGIKTNNMVPANGGGAGTGDIAINSPITIYQQPGQSTDELASIVAIKIGEAVADARASSILV